MIVCSSFLSLRPFFLFIGGFRLNSLLFDLEIDGRRPSEKITRGVATSVAKSAATTLEKSVTSSVVTPAATSEVSPFRDDGRCGIGWEGPNGEPEAACDTA